MSDTHDAGRSHEITITPASRLDGGDWWRAVCSCGNYQSAPSRFPGHAEIAGRDHVNAKNGAAR